MSFLIATVRLKMWKRSFATTFTRHVMPPAGKFTYHCCRSANVLRKHAGNGGTRLASLHKAICFLTAPSCKVRCPLDKASSSDHLNCYPTLCQNSIESFSLPLKLKQLKASHILVDLIYFIHDVNV